MLNISMRERTAMAHERDTSRGGRSLSVKGRLNRLIAVNTGDGALDVGDKTRRDPKEDPPRARRSGPYARSM
jgi:hypothetical protein